MVYGTNLDYFATSGQTLRAVFYDASGSLWNGTEFVAESSLANAAALAAAYTAGAQTGAEAQTADNSADTGHYQWATTPSGWQSARIYAVAPSPSATWIATAVASVRATDTDGARLATQNRSNATGVYPASVLVNAPTGSTINLTNTYTTIGAIAEQPIEQFQYDAFGPHAIPCGESQAGDSHKFVAYTDETLSTVLFTLDSTKCVVGGTGSKTVTVTDTDTVTGTAGLFPYRLHNTTDDTTPAYGYLRLKPNGNISST